MDRPDVSELARRLAREAEAVCRHYLSAGRREGGYWLVGNVRNTPGRSLYVRLKESRNGSPGKWSDAATGEHGDLLDVIRESCGLADFRAVADEARAFLSMPRETETSDLCQHQRTKVPIGSPEAARRLFQMARPIMGTLAETYFRNRGITILHDLDHLRFHPRCYYRTEEPKGTETWPALIASVTDLTGIVTGVHRTWLDPNGFDEARLGKAPVASPRRSMGDLLGHAVRMGKADELLAVGEGIETMLSIRQALPTMPIAAALSAGHLAALLLPDTLRRLYVAVDNDPAGRRATGRLAARARSLGIESIPLRPHRMDFNDDLRAEGDHRLRALLRAQLAPEDIPRLVPTP